jgi:ADP-heptose:LPS heptosyltransferase
MNPLRQLNFDKEIKKAAFIQPGAIGDCVLTLPLAAFVKKNLGLHQIDLIGRTEYTSFYPARTTIDRVRSMELLPMHRLFESPEDFALEDNTRLIQTFFEYDYVISFLGSDYPHFEQNLLFAIHCSHSGEVTMMPMTPTEHVHTAQFHIQEFVKRNPLLECEIADCTKDIYIRPLPTDLSAGTDILNCKKISEQAAICLIHPGSGGMHKCWAAENFVALAKVLRTRSVEPIFLLGPAEQERFSESVQNQFKKNGYVLSGLDLDSVFQVLSCVDYFVGNDSGISHIAGAMGKKTAALFGPTNPIYYRPLGPHVNAIQSDFKTHSQSLFSSILGAFNL